MTKNLIVITGVGCNGKTPMAVGLRDNYSMYLMHTDLYYLPTEGDKPNSILGVEDPQKTEYIKSMKENLTKTSVLEGSHAGNSKELDIWIKYLGIEGQVVVLEAQSPNFVKWAKEKHGPEVDLKGVIDYYKSMADIKPEAIVTCYEDIDKFLNANHGALCVPRPHNN